MHGGVGGHSATWATRAPWWPSAWERRMASMAPRRPFRELHPLCAASTSSHSCLGWLGGSVLTGTRALRLQCPAPCSHLRPCCHRCKALCLQQWE